MQGFLKTFFYLGKYWSRCMQHVLQFLYHVMQAIFVKRHCGVPVETVPTSNMKNLIWLGWRMFIVTVFICFGWKFVGDEIFVDFFTLYSLYIVHSTLELCKQVGRLTMCCAYIQGVEHQVIMS